MREEGRNTRWKKKEGGKKQLIDMLKNAEVKGEHVGVHPELESVEGGDLKMEKNDADMMNACWMNLSVSAWLA